MDDDAREALIDRVAARAEAVLPSHDEVLRAVDEDHDPGPVVSPVIAIVALVLAVSLGVAIALVSQCRQHAAPATRSPITTFLPSRAASFPATDRATPAQPASTAPAGRRRHSTTIGRRRDRAHDIIRSARRRPVIDARPPGRREITLSPTQRPTRVRTITVTGSGFPPSSVVQLSYAGGRSTSTRAGRPERPLRRPAAGRRAAARQRDRHGDRSGSKQASSQFTQQALRTPRRQSPCSISGDEERELERLAGVQPRVAGRLVPPAEVGVVDVERTAEAFGDVLTGELDVDAAGPRAQRPVHLEEAAHLVDDVVELAGLVAAR